MIGKLWLSSTLIVITIISTSFSYKIFKNIEESKNIKESYKIINDVKRLLSKQYGKDISKISRDEILSYLPKTKNWGKVLLLDRNEIYSTNNELVNEKTDFILDENEKIRLLALKSKLANIIDLSNKVPIKGKYSFPIGNINKNDVINEELDNSLNNIISYLEENIIYNKIILKDEQFSNIINFFKPKIISNEKYKEILFEKLKEDKRIISKELYKKVKGL